MGSVMFINPRFIDGKLGLELGLVLGFLSSALGNVNVMQCILRQSVFELRLVFSSVLFGNSV